ncbi:MAG: hypothetical protein MUF45_08495 [Spirosomaceae bacterium]|jgi:transcriptional regulator with XRE-family HTH domain|nr:hypothetical protein [Spirosomataceae bacterium]
MDESTYWIKKLKQIKEIEGFKTDKELADLLSVTAVTIHDYMKGVNKQMKSDSLKRLRQLGYSYDWLLDDVGEPKKDLSPELLAKVKDLNVGDVITRSRVEEEPIIESVKPNTSEKLTDSEVFEHPIAQYMQQETLLLRELVYKLVLQK